jgi:1,4-alpha-glucan branching enzyme
MGWMHDILEYASKDPVHRRWSHFMVTFSMLYAYTENFILPLSHDEVVHGKGALLDKVPGDLWQKFATLRTLYGFMYGHPGKKLLFMGAEFGQWREWNHDQSLDWHLLEFAPHAGVQRWVRDLNHLYRAEPCLHAVDHQWTGFEWIDCNDSDQSTLAYLRRGVAPDEAVIAAFNFTPVPRHDFHLGAPWGGFWQELLSSDAHDYGGTGQGNCGGVEAEAAPCHGRSHTLHVTLPPLGVVLLKGRRPPLSAAAEPPPAAAPAGKG